MKKVRQLCLALALVVFASSLQVGPVYGQASPPLVNPNDQGIGMTGRLVQPPPSTGPSISLPADGTVFEEIPITVTGLCTDQLLVRVFRNNVFSGAAVCDGGSYQLQIDLFPGTNVITARQYDDLDQASPDSNAINVTYNIDVPVVPGSPDQVLQRVTLTSTFARRGADPGSPLIWPITLSGGTGPYAISIDWGDGKEELLTQNTAGTFDMQHTYERSGVYRIIVRATDANGESAFLQLVGIANGEINTATEEIAAGPAITKTKILWQPMLIALPLILTSFWLGKRYQLRRTRYRIKHHIIPIDK